jgi:hypothetical protein
LHYYKRNLTPIKESFGFCNEKTPYRSNFDNYKGTLISAHFRNELVGSLSRSTGRVKCVTTDNRGYKRPHPDKVMQTYFYVVEGARGGASSASSQRVVEDAPKPLADKKPPSQWI